MAQAHQDVAPTLARIPGLAAAPATAPAVPADTANAGPAHGLGQKDKKADTLFGPNIGIVSGGPKWTERKERKAAGAGDELTPEIVRAWMAKSKQVSVRERFRIVWPRLSCPLLHLACVVFDADYTFVHRRTILPLLSKHS